MESQENNTFIKMIRRRELIIALLGAVTLFAVIATVLLFRQNSKYEQRILQLEDKVCRMEGSKEIQDAMKREREIIEQLRHPKIQEVNMKGAK